MSNLDFVKSVACNWANESIRLGGSLLSNNESRARTSLDEHFFLTSATMLNKCCNYIADNSSDAGEIKAAKAFIDVSEDARDVRNKREHFDEYIDGNHKTRQSQFTTERGNTIADSTSTIVDDSGYHLGNKATVETIVAACHDFLKFVKSPW